MENPTDNRENTKNLGPDEKMLILMELPPHEAITVCESSKEMNLQCQNNKYNELWKQKIKKDFKVTYNGNKAYQEYKFLQKLYQKPLYVVIRYDEDEDEIDSFIFDTEEKAERYIYSVVNDNYSYSSMKIALNSEKGLHYSYHYRIEKQYINNEIPEDEYFESEKQEYEGNREKLMHLVEEDDHGAFIESINDFAFKFNDRFEHVHLKGNTLTNAQNQINDFIQNMLVRFDLLDAENFKPLLVKYLSIQVEDRKKFF